MAVRTVLLGGTDFSDGEVLYSADMNDTLNDIGQVPIGAIVPWLKTFSSVSTGTADTNTADKLVNSGATFETDGVEVGMIIHNTTDDTFGIVSAVDNETSISIAADSASGSAVTDVFPDGDENYVIYATPKLNPFFLECNGQTVSDAASVYNGETLPDLNDSDNLFLRGYTSSGTGDSSPVHNHQWAQDDGNNVGIVAGNASGLTVTESSFNSSGTTLNFAETSNLIDGDYYTSNEEAIPPYYKVVFIMRVK